MKAVRKILSVILTLAMLLTLTPMVFAVDEAVAPRVPLSEITADRILCVVNSCISGDESSTLSKQPQYIYVPDSNGNNMKLSTYVNEDGTFTDAAYEEAKKVFDQLVESGLIEKDFISGITFPNNVFEAFELVTEMLYNSVIESLKEDELDGTIAALTEAFPDAKALHADIMNTYFGDRIPTIAELLYFVAGDAVIIDDEGYVMTKYSESFYNEYGTYILCIGDVIARNGAYYMPFEKSGNHLNVYAQLKDAYEAKEITEEDAFALLTGYYTDLSGYLYTITPIYNYIYNKDGNHITNTMDLINEDGTVWDSGLSAYDFIVNFLTDRYLSRNSGIDIQFDDASDYFNTAFALLAEFLPVIDDPEIEMTEDEVRKMYSDKISEYIEIFKNQGISEKELYAAFLNRNIYFERSALGYIADGHTYGYIYDADGNMLKTSDIMDSEGKFLTDEYGAETVWELLDAYIADMKTDIALKGDATGDGKVNLNDASAMLKKIAKWDIEIYDDAADVNGDKKVTLSDVSLVMRYIAGWGVYFEY